MTTVWPELHYFWHQRPLLNPCFIQNLLQCNIKNYCRKDYSMTFPKEEKVWRTPFFHKSLFAFWLVTFHIFGWIWAPNQHHTYQVLHVARLAPARHPADRRRAEEAGARRRFRRPRRSRRTGRQGRPWSRARRSPWRPGWRPAASRTLIHPEILCCSMDSVW